MSTPAPLPRAPVVFLVLAATSLIAWPLLPLLPVALLGGLWGLWRARTDAGWAARRQVSRLVVAVAGAGLLIVGGMALPTLKRWQLRERQRACPEALATLLAAEGRLHQRSSRYGTSLAELGVDLPRGAFLLRLSPEGPLWRAGPLEPVHEGLAPAPPHDAAAEAWDQGLPPDLRASLGVRGACPGCAVTLACVANLDGDEALDAWSISSAERPGPGGRPIPAATPWNHRDDVAE